MATPKLTLIENALGTLIESMSTTNEYLLNWGTVNLEDRALEDNSLYNAYAVIYLSEENDDDFNEALSNLDYGNVVKLRIEVRTIIDSESSNPKFDSRKNYLYKALHDLKKLFGINSSLNNTACRILYNKARIMEKGNRSGDRFSPKFLEVSFNVWYSQNRQDLS